jgi:hypothetical protein
MVGVGRGGWLLGGGPREDGRAESRGAVDGAARSGGAEFVRGGRHAIWGICLAGVLVVSGAGLVGCSGNPKITKTFTPTASESHRSETPQAVAEYQPATETSPPKNVPVPKYPEAAKAKTKAGQKAFIEYWFKTYNYAFDTGDIKPIQAVSGEDSQLCEQTN